MNRIRIVCRDGIATSVSVYEIDGDGNERELDIPITRIDWSVKAMEIARAVIYVDCAEVDVVGETPPTSTPPTPPQPPPTAPPGIGHPETWGALGPLTK